TWSSGNDNIDKIIQLHALRWMSYDDFKDVKHIADGVHGPVYSAKLKNGIEEYSNSIEHDWEYDLIDRQFALKEIKDPRYDIAEFFKVIKIVNNYELIAKYYGISKNPSTQNYIIIMDLFDGDLHNFLIKKFWDLGWKSKIDILESLAWGLECLHARDFIHCDLHNKLFDNIVDNDDMRQLKIADENQKNTSKSQKQELFELFLYSSKLHPQSCYISRCIHTLHGLHDLLEALKSGNSSDPNLLLKSNESATSDVNTYNIDSKEEKEIQKQESN
ncbi:7382_t:CDS:2, partial [Diversispora eburnea]